MNQENSKAILRKLRAALLIAGTFAAAPSTASTGYVSLDPVVPAVGPVQIPAFLGGVSLQRPQLWQPAPAYDIGSVSAGYGPHGATEAFDAIQGQPASGLDPIQTGAIISGVFGSFAISMRNFPAVTRWAPVYKAISDCSTDEACGNDNPAFTSLLQTAQDKNFADKLAFVNSGVNHLIAYRKDQRIYGMLDYWAKPAEILSRQAGDCEDFAILKMAALLRVGIPANSMSLVVLQDRRRAFFHAVLSVSTTSGTFILDSLDDRVARDTDLPDYVPLYSFSTDRAWVHGSKSGAAKVAKIKGGFAAIAPGEGPQAEPAQ